MSPVIYLFMTKTEDDCNGEALQTVCHHIRIEEKGVSGRLLVKSFADW